VRISGGIESNQLERCENVGGAPDEKSMHIKIKMNANIGSLLKNLDSCALRLISTNFRYNVTPH
jgi:hypothetical protein